MKELEELKTDIETVENDILRCKSRKSIKSLRLLSAQLRRELAKLKRDLLQS